MEEQPKPKSVRAFFRQLVYIFNLIIIAIGMTIDNWRAARKNKKGGSDRL